MQIPNVDTTVLDSVEIPVDSVPLGSFPAILVATVMGLASVEVIPLFHTDTREDNYFDMSQIE